MTKEMQNKLADIAVLILADAQSYKHMSGDIKISGNYKGEWVDIWLTSEGMTVWCCTSQNIHKKLASKLAEIDDSLFFDIESNNRMSQVLQMDVKSYNDVERCLVDTMEFMTKDSMVTRAWNTIIVSGIYNRRNVTVSWQENNQSVKVLVRSNDLTLTKEFTKEFADFAASYDLDAKVVGGCFVEISLY